MVINAIVQPVQVRIGGQDFTENLVQASVYRSGVVFNGILHWYCELVFNLKPTGPVHLDDRSNSVLKRGHLIEITYAGITRKLRVDKAFYDPVRYQLKVNGIDILELFSYRSPADSDLSNYTNQVSLGCGQVPKSIEYTSVSHTIYQLLVYAGISPSLIFPPPISEVVNFYLDKDSNQSYIEMAAEIAASFLYWMEVTPDENIVFHRFTESGASIFYRHDQLLDFKRIEPLLEDPEIICVTGVKKRIVLPKQSFVFGSTERDIADDEVAGTRAIENTITNAEVNYNPCNGYSVRPLTYIIWPRFSVRPKNGRGSYIAEIESLWVRGLSGTPDYEEKTWVSRQTFTSPDPPSDSDSGQAFRWTSSLSLSGNGQKERRVQKFYRWNQNDLLDMTTEIVGEWQEFQEKDAEGRLKQATIAISGEVTTTVYVYDSNTGLLKQVKIYNDRGAADITETHDDEENPKAYKTKSRIEKERVTNIIDFIDNETIAIKRTTVEGERFVREVVYEGEEDLPREDGDEYVTVSERQSSSDSFFEYIENIPGGERRPPLTSETEEIIEVEYSRSPGIGYLPRKKEIKINWAFNREQLLNITAWFSRYYVYKQNEYEIAVALEPRLWQLQGFVGCSVLGIYGIIDSISFAWTQEGSSECLFRLLGTGYYREEIPPYQYVEYSISEPPPSREKVVIRPIPDYEVFVGETISIVIGIYFGIGPLRITVVGLPTELSFNASSRVISGIASSVGVHSITVNVIDEGDNNYSVSRSFTLTIKQLPSVIPSVPPTGKLDLASGGQLSLSFLNYARDSWQVFYVRLTAGATLQIRSRMNVFGLASGAAWKVEVRVTVRGFGFAAGSGMRLYAAQSSHGLVSGNVLGIGRALVVGLSGGQAMGLFVKDWLLDLVAGGAVQQLVSEDVLLLASGSNLEIDQAKIVGLASGASFRVISAYTTLLMAGGSAWDVVTEISETFDILMAQSMNVEVGYIEQQVYE